MTTEASVSRNLTTLLEEAARETMKALDTFDAFWADPATRVPLPPTLAIAGSVLQPLGLDRQVLEFQMTLNRAAARAVPKLLPVFLRVISRMSWKEARRIVRGPDDAATRYLEEHARDELRAAIRPIAAEATEEVELTRRYKEVERLVRPFVTRIDPTAPDLDDFVAEHALEACFFVMRREERKLRRDPVGRIAELLRAGWKR